MNKKMEMLKKAEKVNHVFDKMDKETQEAVKSLINHLMVAKTKKENGIETIEFYDPESEATTEANEWKKRVGA